MPLARAAVVSELPPGAMMEARAGGRVWALCHAAGEIHAVSGICPHLGGPLAQGALHGFTIVCPWHAWEFDCRTGAHDWFPAVRLETAPVVVRDGSIFLNLPDA